MPRIRRSFSPELKAQVVLELLSGAATPAEIARRHQVKPQLLAHWKAAVLERLPTLFGGDDAHRQHEARIAELEQLVGRQALELELLKKSLTLADWPNAQRREVVMTLAKTYPLRLVCRLLGLSRSSVYYAPKPPPDETLLANAVLDLCEEWPVFGYRRITQMLRRLDWRVNPKRVRRIMADLGLGGLAPAKSVRTTNSAHAFPRYDNLVQDLKTQHPEQVWVADITYVKLPREFVYLAIVMDVFTRIIRGWHLGRSLDQGLTLAALERALVFGTPRIHHSDQGVQYAATAYVEAPAKPRCAPEHGQGRRTPRERLRRTADADHQGGRGDALRLPRLRRGPPQPGTVHRRDLQREADSLVAGYLTPREFEARWKEQQAMATTTSTAAEDRAPVGTDPSAAAGPSPIGAAGRRSVASAGPQSDKSISVVSET